MKKGFKYERIYLFTLTLAVVIFFLGLVVETFDRHQLIVLGASVAIIILNMLVWAKDRQLSFKMRLEPKGGIHQKNLKKARAKWCVAVNFVLLMIVASVVLRFLV